MRGQQPHGRFQVVASEADGRGRAAPHRSPLARGPTATPSSPAATPPVGRYMRYAYAPWHTPVYAEDTKLPKNGHLAYTELAT
jgi:hypothetical protein